MAQMTDPMNSLVGLQDALKKRLLQMERGRAHPDIGVHMDQPKAGTTRLTYAKISPTGSVKAIAVFVTIEPYEGLPCFQIGYAVAPAFQRQGNGAEIVKKSIEEMINGFKAVMPSFYIEAIVGAQNEASLKIAGKYIAKEAREIEDEFSREPAKQFFRRIG